MNLKMHLMKIGQNPNGNLFFEKNTWIFGYGLDYKFLSILQKKRITFIGSRFKWEKMMLYQIFLVADKNFTIIG